VRHIRIAVVAAATVALAACGSSGSSESGTTAPARNGRQVVLASVVKTAAADSAEISLDMSFAGLGSSGVSVTAGGVVDFESGDSQLMMEFGGMFGSFLPDGIEARSVDGVTYVRLPIGLPEGKEWVAVDTQEIGGSGSNTALDIGGGTDPKKMLAYLEKVSAGVQEVGTETIRGTETTHYSADLDLAKAVDRADVPPALHDALDEMAGSVGTVPVDIWIDGDGLLRRQQMKMDFASFLPGGQDAGNASGETPTVTMTLDLFDFGTPVEVDAPPPDQVISVGDGFGGERSAEPGGAPA
jgi:hypothetical protein